MNEPVLAVEGRFKELEIRFGQGEPGRNLDIPSASPLNYHQAISDPAAMPELVVDGKLFLPAEGEAPFPCVIVAPGSMGVAPSHVAHAETLTEAGLAAFVLDSFGPRAVTSTVANQTQFSFAASAYDVLAAFRVLAEVPEIDTQRIGAQGHSRGGTAVLMAASRRLADAVIGEGARLHGVLAAYPWCGHQFTDPRVGDTVVRVIMGDRDEWCSPMQAQAYCHTVRLTGGSASMRLLGETHHSFDRGTELTNIENAKISPAAPTAYIADDGAFLHPLEDTPDPSLVDRDLMVYALKAGYGNVGAHIGSRPGDAELFREDMLRFWTDLD